MSFDFLSLVKYWPVFLEGLGVTVAITVSGIALSLVFGLAVALARMSGRRWLTIPALAVIEFARNLPFIVILYLFFFGIPAMGLRLSSFLVGLLAMTVYGAGYYAEIFRAALRSVPAGQREAALSSGMTRIQALRLVILPQTWSFFIPPGTNQAIMLLKESAVLSTITVLDLTMAAQVVQGYTYSAVEVFVLIAVLYWVLTTLVVRVGRALERRVSIPGQGIGAGQARGAPMIRELPAGGRGPD